MSQLPIDLYTLVVHNMMQVRFHNATCTNCTNIDKSTATLIVEIFVKCAFCHFLT